MSSTGNDEVANAAAAAAAVNKNDDDDDPPTVFDKILSGEWDSVKVYEDDEALAFRDVNPCAPVHCLVIPKHRNGLTGISKATVNQKAILGHLLFVAATVGNKECPTGYRIVINEGKDGAQSVNHLHLHVMGGRQMEWPPG